MAYSYDKRLRHGAHSLCKKFIQDKKLVKVVEDIVLDNLDKTNVKESSIKIKEGLSEIGLTADEIYSILLSYANLGYDLSC